MSPLSMTSMKQAGYFSLRSKQHGDENRAVLTRVRSELRTALYWSRFCLRLGFIAHFQAAEAENHEDLSKSQSKPLKSEEGETSS